MFAHIFSGEVRKWFRALPVARISTLEELQRQFLDRWEIEKKPLHILQEYEHIKWNVGESVQYYCTRFNSIYKAIPDHLRPLEGLAMMKFLDSFDADMAYQLREREPSTMEDMHKIAVSVEANVLAKRARARAEKKVTVKEESSSIDQLLWKME